MSPIATTPPPPYWAVLFTTRLTGRDGAGYEATSDRLVELAQHQPGFLGLESVRGADGVGITISYWRTPDDAEAWRDVAVHRDAQRAGRERWYERYELRVCRVESARSFAAPRGREGAAR